MRTLEIEKLEIPRFSEVHRWPGGLRRLLDSRSHRRNRLSHERVREAYAVRECLNDRLTHSEQTRPGSCETIVRGPETKHPPALVRPLAEQDTHASSRVHGPKWHRVDGLGGDKERPGLRRESRATCRGTVRESSIRRVDAAHDSAGRLALVVVRVRDHAPSRLTCSAGLGRLTRRRIRGPARQLGAPVTAQMRRSRPPTRG
jgi:hypothetical protein